MRYAFCSVVAVLMLTACGRQSADDPIYGWWTPVSVGNCSQEAGVLVGIRSDSLGVYRSSGDTPLGKLLGVERPSEGIVDLVYRPVQGEGDARRLASPERIRFQVVAPDHLRAIGQMRQGEALRPLTPAAAEILDMKRCP